MEEMTDKIAQDMRGMMDIVEVRTADTWGDVLGHKVVARGVYTVFFIKPSSCSNINFTADYGLYPLLFGFFIKIHSAVHYTVVSYGHSSLTQLLGSCHKTFNAAGAIEQAVFTMNM